MNRLAELEAHILDYYLQKGYKLEKDQTEEDTKWNFNIAINTQYKKKTLEVWTAIGDLIGQTFSISVPTTKEMFDKAFENFKIEDTNTYEVLADEKWQKTNKNFYKHTLLPTRLNGVETNVYTRD
jgi:hypothetical protein